MAFTEIALVSLAMSLAQNPSSTDLQKYQSLSASQKTAIEFIIESQDKLPDAFEKLIQPGDLKGIAVGAPTSESSGGAGST